MVSLVFPCPSYSAIFIWYEERETTNKLLCKEEGAVVRRGGVRNVKKLPKIEDAYKYIFWLPSGWIPNKTFAHYYTYFVLKVLQTLEYFLKLPLDIFSKQQIN